MAPTVKIVIFFIFALRPVEFWDSEVGLRSSTHRSEAGVFETGLGDSALLQVMIPEAKFVRVGEKSYYEHSHCTAFKELLQLSLHGVGRTD